MAYSDYGAFVYRDMGRRRDREDGGAFAKDADGKDGYGMFHAVLGDGDFRLCIYKTAAHMAELMTLKDGMDRPETVDVYSHLRLNCGRDLPDPGDFAELGEDDREWMERNLYGPFAHVFEYDGRTVTLSYDGSRQVGGYAKVVEPDGTVWQAWYDSGFGAGITDERFTDKWETLDPDTKAMRPYRRVVAGVESGFLEDYELCYERAVFHVGSKDVDASFVGGPRTFERDGEEWWEPAMYAGGHEDVSEHPIGADDFIVDLVNFGIRLGRQGYDEVAFNSSRSNWNRPASDFPFLSEGDLERSVKVEEEHDDEVDGQKS